MPVATPADGNARGLWDATSPVVVGMPSSRGSTPRDARGPMIPRAASVVKRGQWMNVDDVCLITNPPLSNVIVLCHHHLLCCFLILYTSGSSFCKPFLTNINQHDCWVWLVHMLVHDRLFIGEKSTPVNHHPNRGVKGGATAIPRRWWWKLGTETHSGRWLIMVDDNQQCCLVVL